MAIRKLATQSVNFQNLLGKMTVTDRLKAIQSDDGQFKSFYTVSTFP